MDNHSIAKLAKEKGNIAFEAKHYVTARSLYSHAIAYDQSNYIYPLNRSQANVNLERWDEAEADATKTLELCPRNLKALLRRGMARKELGKWNEARADIQMFADNEGNSKLAAQELKAIADAESSAPSEPSSYVPSGLENDLANLHLQDDSDTSFFSIRSSAAFQNGKGSFASRDIQRGDLILSEKPIFIVPTNAPESLRRTYIEAAVRNLSPANLDSYLSLQNSHDKCSCFFSPLLGIFGTNAFAMSDSGGICFRGARFNHSCSPNARFTFNSRTGKLRIYALGTIRRGEEIFVGYVDYGLIGRRLYASPRQMRQAVLRTRYHFTCACSVCSLPEAESKISDTRRQKINELWETIRSSDPRTQGVQNLNIIVQAMRLRQEEGYLADADDFTNEAAPTCAFHSDWLSSSYWAGLTYHTRVAEFGEDSPQAAEVRQQYLNPRTFRSAGLGPPMDLTRFRV